jgi:putative nucleotidyltransferase with HDIG domain
MVFMLVTGGMFLGVSNYTDSKMLAIDILKRNNQSELRNISDYYFEKLIYDMEFIVKTWAEDSDIVSYEKENGQGRYVKSIPENFEEIQGKWVGIIRSMENIAWMYYALEEDGSIFIAPVDETMPSDYDARTRDWYIGTARENGDVFWTEPYIDAGESGKLLQTVSRGVYRNNELVGVVGLDIELQKFTEIINELSYSKHSYIFLLNQMGDILAHNSEFPPELKPYVRRAAYNSDELITIDSVEYVSSSVPISINDWKLVAITRTNLESELRIIRNRIFGIVSTVILFGIFISIVLSRHLLRPLNSLILATDEVSRGNFKIRTNTKSKDEFNILSNSFNHMLDHIEDLIKERDKNYLKTVTVLANAIEASDEYTRGHCDRVGEISLKIGKKMGLSERQMDNLRFACILHDVGKIGINDRILNKPSALTKEEYEVIKKHPMIGYEIIKEVDFLEEPANIMLQHHERIDGNGYPNGIKGEEIRLEAKILAVADTYDSISSERVYRKRVFTKEEIKEELIRSSDTQLDTEVVNVLLDILDEKEI